MRNILTRVKMDLLETRTSLIACAISAVLITALMVSFFPSFEGLDAELNAYIEAFPPAMLEAFGIVDTDFSDFNVYIGSEYFGFFWAVVFIPFLVSWIVKFAREGFNGSLGLTLSYPISRAEVGLAMYISLLIKSIFTSVIMVGSVMIAVRFIDTSIDLSNWFTFMGHVALVLTAISFLGGTLSIITEKPGRVTSIMSLFLVGGYFFNIMAKLFDELDMMKYISIFHYYGEPTPILRSGEVEFEKVLVMLVFTAVMFTVGIWKIRSVDLPKG